MPWVLGSLTLVAVAFSLRRILHMGALKESTPPGGGPLRANLEAIYRPLAQEIEAHTSILGITLNEAFNERTACRHDMAWRIIDLTVGEWNRLAELLVSVHSILFKYLPASTGVVPVRRIYARDFRSRSVIDNVGMYEFLDQILFSSRGRYALQLRLLFRSGTLLTKEFKRSCRAGHFALDCSDELWTHLDYCFHDFDLIAKQTLLAFRILLTSLSAERTQELAEDLQSLLESGVCVSVLPANQ
jgi:hypothetical protein